MPWPAVGEMNCRWSIVGNARDHWRIQSVGYFVTAVGLSLVCDDQPEMPVIARAEPRMITEYR